ncbi:MAG: pyridoxal 5'-phosphate synthase glutaminase subunit PdxT [Coxiellaceae bacterium]|nr:pyridoxal 5'-phosphate synthase glutaminase subunit PdxT [Coxiellaceae bacterium]|tara:strand:+ start:4027 stop:4602 length:576 start_codon:yes stop_codon:yes gene_type:complete
MTPQVGILALQGGYALHGDQLDRCGVPWCFVRQPDELVGLKGLIMPGGESTALLKLMAPFQWQQAIIDFAAQGGAILATCAGLILSAKTVSPVQESLALLPIRVERNAYGRQRESFTTTGQCNDAVFSGGDLDMVFIRAPRITHIDSSVTVLATYKEDPVLVQYGSVIGATFHPELARCTHVHEYFCQQIR